MHPKILEPSSYKIKSTDNILTQKSVNNQIATDNIPSKRTESNSYMIRQIHTQKNLPLKRIHTKNE